MFDKKYEKLSILILILLSLLSSCKNHVHEFSEEWNFDDEYHWNQAICDDTDEVINKSEHFFCEKVIIEVPSEEKTGLAVYECTICGYRRYVEIEKIEHQHIFSSEWEFDETYHWHPAICEHTDVFSDYEKHFWNEGEETKASTYTEKGEKKYTCSICGSVKIEEIPLLQYQSYPPRYLAMGFDDFRESDFTLILPLLKKYNAHATFNIITYDLEIPSYQKERINELILNGNELGNHTFFHCNFIYSDPLFNGQNPKSIDGEQIPFPSNDQMRNDIGGGRNIFGFSINESCAVKLSEIGLIWNGCQTKWKNLSDEECQSIRDFFSIYKDTSGRLQILDELSNKYLGTNGRSFGSWDNAKGCYTGGIFTDSKTSCNHEIWERLLQINEMMYKHQVDSQITFYTWSMPGDWYSPFKFHLAGKVFDDSTCLISDNYSARFYSSINHYERSFTEVLRSCNYLMTYDSMYPSRVDGNQNIMMSKQLIMNASYSRKDALLYPTNRTVGYLGIAQEYPESFFTSEQTKAQQMYDYKQSFYEFLEALRHDTSNGIVHGEVIDSENTYSEQVFLESLLEYCKKTDVKVISKKEAYDICFNQINIQGNLLYNPTFRNTIKEFIPNSLYLPNNPDGYIGDCFVDYDNSVPVLHIQDKTKYDHFGIPTGFLEFSGECKGSGMILIYAIKNSDLLNSSESALNLIKSISIDSENYSIFNESFLVQTYGNTTWNQMCENEGCKITGLRFIYSGDISLKNLELKLK